MTMLGDESREAGDAHATEPLKILVVDDEPAMVGALGALLGQAGHRIIAAYDGDEALRRFRDDEPDLVLLDLAMPGMDGATVCRRIRDSSDTPVIVVSGERDHAATIELLDNRPGLLVRCVLPVRKQPTQDRD